jgi:hypothetical protein
MTIYYSPSTNGFYDTDFAEYNLPSDVVEITKDEHQAIFEQQAAGKVIKSGLDKKPTTVDRPALNYVELRMSEYPSIQDQLDAIWKGGNAQIEMETKIKSIKDKYPKV